MRLTRLKNSYIYRERVEQLQSDIREINEHIIRNDEVIKTLSRLTFTIIDKD